MNLWLILLCVSLIANIILTWRLTFARERIDDLEALVWVQDEIVTAYREKFGDIKIDLSSKKE